MQSSTIPLYPKRHKALVAELTGCVQLKVQGLKIKIAEKVTIQLQVCRVVKAPGKQAKHEPELLAGPLYAGCTTP